MVDLATHFPGGDQFRPRCRPTRDINGNLKEEKIKEMSSANTKRKPRGTGARKARQPDQIDWRKLNHVKVGMNDEETSLILKLKPSNVPLPKVTIITDITNAILFQCCVYSWKAMTYPHELLNWVIVDNDKLFQTGNMVDKSLLDDKRVRVIQFVGKYNDMVKRVMDMPWVEVPPLENDPSAAPKEEVLIPQDTAALIVPSVGQPEEPTDVKEEPTDVKEEAVAVQRGHVFTSLACGDITYPDTLSAKHRAMVSFGADCVTPDILAFYNPVGNVSLVLKMFPEYPESGLYWKKGWWDFKSPNRCVGMPYIGNCVTIGLPTTKGVVQLSSVRFFDAFPDPIKELVKSILQGMTTLKDPESSDSEDDH